VRVSEDGILSAEDSTSMSEQVDGTSFMHLVSRVLPINLSPNYILSYHRLQFPFFPFQAYLIFDAILLFSNSITEQSPSTGKDPILALDSTLCLSSSYVLNWHPRGK
jgi:hypothetical protein